MIYLLDRDEYDKKWYKYKEDLDYGDAFNSQTDCGTKKYTVECDNAWLDDDIIHMEDDGEFIIAPWEMELEKTIFTECHINAYFADYDPANEETA